MQEAATRINLYFSPVQQPTLLKLDALCKRRRWSRTQSVDYLINYYESTEAAARQLPLATRF